MPPYNEKATPTVNEAKQPELESIMSRFYNYNNEYYSSLSRLEERLNKILNRERPEKQLTDHVDKKQQDMITSLDEQCSRLSTANAKFERLLEHLFEIA